ncbi:acyltransferase family protein [Microbacteriaceae bacterium VKM Ac-2854]|nr:acyltransferase family protein [Microbacteriaceae bacterium VKM Ac-2854]
MQQDRLAWPDVTRGLGVLAVVLFHSLIWSLDAVAPSGIVTTVWDQIGSSLGRIRMPILFGLAGLLASRSLLAGRGAARVRLVANGYLYLLWLVLYGLFFFALARPDFPHSIDTVGQWATQLYYPTTTLWFLFALALYPLLVLLLARLRLPPWAVLLFGVGLWLLGSNLTAPLFGGALLLNFVFFAFGVHATGWLRSFAEPGAARILLPFCAFLVAVLLTHLLGENVGILASAAAIPLAIACAARISAWTPAARLGAFVGSRTLSIYLLHVPLLGLWSLLPSGVLEAALAQPLLAAVFPVLLTAVLVAGSLGIGALLRRIPTDPLLTPPARLLAAVRSRRRAHAA